MLIEDAFSRCRVSQTLTATSSPVPLRSEAALLTSFSLEWRLKRRVVLHHAPAATKERLSRRARRVGDLAFFEEM
jgi:hypothetical protein